MRLLLLGLLACGPEASKKPQPTEVDVAPIDAFRTAVDEAGWTAGEGAFVEATQDLCCEALVFCLDTDPGAPYTTVALPPAPGQESVGRDRYWMWGDTAPEGTSRDYSLRPDEAVVWIGTAPPRADHFSYGTLLSTREDGYGARNWVLGALGPSLNAARIADERGVDIDAIWGRPLVVVTASDAAIEAQVVDWLVGAGFDPTTVHTDRLPASSLRLGLGPSDDSFATWTQVVDSADPVAQARWEGAGATVLRLTPDELATSAPFDPPTIGSPGSGTDEEGLRAAVDELEARIRSTYAPALGVPGPVVWTSVPPLACIDGLDCGGDPTDRLRGESIELTLEPVNFAVAFGVNHVASGKSSASTVAVHRKHTGTALGHVDDDALFGSARAFLGDNHPDADALFAVILARDCDDWFAPCLEVPPMCPAPLEEDRMTVIFSEYLDPATGLAPASEELIRPRVLKFFQDLGQ